MSPVAALHPFASPSSDSLKELSSRPVVAAVPAATVVPETAAAPVAAGSSAAANDSGSTEASAAASDYSVRTSFDAATGEWALVVERHPPEVGVIVAERKGFVSQYAAMANSPMNLSSGFSAQI